MSTITTMPNCTAIYFSPTGNSKKSAISVAQRFCEAFGGGSCREIDITPASTADVHESFEQSDLVVFALPVYGGRLPKVGVERLANFQGNYTPCVILVTYGNRDYDDALVELADVVSDNGFLVRGAAALVGRHSYGEIQVDRPNESDLAENRHFAERFLVGAACSDVEPEIKGTRPYKPDFASGHKFIPATSPACIECTLCVKHCPTGAIAADCRNIDSALCISCFGCIRVCPVHAKLMDDPVYKEFADAFSQKLAAPRPNEYFLCEG